MRLPRAVSRLAVWLGILHDRQPQVRPVLPVRDLDRAQQDLESLGLVVRRWDDGYAWVFHDGHEVLHLKLVVDLDPASNHAEIYVLVDDVDDWHDRATRAGIEAGTVDATSWGMREFAVDDDSGNRLRFGHDGHD